MFVFLKGSATSYDRQGKLGRDAKMIRCLKWYAWEDVRIIVLKKFTKRKLRVTEIVAATDAAFGSLSYVEKYIAQKVWCGYNIECFYSDWPSPQLVSDNLWFPVGKDVFK